MNTADPKACKIRRKYSKNGCLECKRRKVKCDETKPECWQCTHLSKRCEYVTQNIKFKKVSMKGRTGSKPTTSSTPLKEPSINPVVINDTTRGHTIPKLGITDTYRTTSDMLDLNSLLNAALLSANDLFSMAPVSSCELENVQLLNRKFLRGSFKNWNFVSSALANISDLELDYLEKFFYNVSYWLMPLSLSPSENTCNHILFYHIMKMHIIEHSTSSYLQSSMVSIGAKYAYNITGDENHNTIRRHFLRKALQQLHDAFEILPKGKANTSQIESLILCVLLLTLDSSTFNGQQWKVHLRSVKDLFMKYDTAETTECDSDEIRKRTIAFARSWFSAISTTASIYKYNSLCSETEIDDLLENGSHSKPLLKKMGFMADNGYNLFLGYSIEGISLLRQVVKCLDTSNYTDSHNKKFIDICTLVQLSRDFYFYPNNLGKIDSRKAQLLQIEISERAVLHYENSTYSFYDSIQQVRVETLFISFLTNCVGLSESSSLVQNACNRVWELVQWIFTDNGLSNHDIDLIIGGLERGTIKTSQDLFSLPLDLVTKCIIPPLRKDFRLMMLQSAFVVSLSRIITPDSATISNIRCRTLAYLTLLIRHLGAESAIASMNYLIKKWYPQSFNLYEKHLPLGDHDVLPFS